MGTQAAVKSLPKLKRTDDEERQKKVEKARALMLAPPYTAITSKKIDKLLKPESLVPTTVSHVSRPDSRVIFQTVC